MPDFPPQAGLRQIHFDRREALHGTEATREIEAQVAASLAAHTLMARAGAAVAALARALHPHAACIWIACGPGNNGGDGLIAATHLHRWAQVSGGTRRVVVTHAVNDATRLPADARWALDTALQAGVQFSDAPPPAFDLAIDALLGIGPVRRFEGQLASWLHALRTTNAPVLSVDLPSGLNTDTGTLAPLSGTDAMAAGHRHTLSLLTLKPGLFTGAGRDAAGDVWLDDLGAPTNPLTASAWLSGHAATQPRRAHASHKGSHGDVVVLGGQGVAIDGAGMTGAAVLAARAALHAGAGRVFVGLLEGPVPSPVTWDPASPELMFRQTERLLDPAVLRAASVVCGCGGGAAIAALLPTVLAHTRALVLDADALNAIAADPTLRTAVAQRRGQGRITVLTPHPLEAARLLQRSTADVMADRVRAAQTLADELGAVCVLKGSGSVIAAPHEKPHINPSGNALLATAGTGDVLAGIVGSALARPGLSPAEAFARVAHGVFQHGVLADRWHHEGPQGLSAARLAARVTPLD